MLTADLVRARRRGNELTLVPLDAAARGQALAIAEALAATAAAHVGRSREDLSAAFGAIDVGPREHRLKDGLVKLVEDGCVFDAFDEAEPSEIRRDVFLRASAARRALDPGQPFDRAAVLAEVARTRNTTPDAIERALFADLRGAHTLTSVPATSPEALVAAYERAQAQAVLLRAVKVTAHVRCASAAAMRALFRQLKFLRLLHAITPTPDGHRIVIDGPFSLFESVTKYGLQLALVLPALEACDVWRLEADVRWGKERTPLVFRLAGERTRRSEMSPLADDALALVRSFEALETSWRVAENADILDLPGVGLCVPDLVFERPRGKTQDRVHLEVLGYWSRDAVWKRVELVQAGLAQSILFAVSSRLRVSEDVLGDDVPGALYVYKRTMSARSILERLDALAGRRSRALKDSRR